MIELSKQNQIYWDINEIHIDKKKQQNEMSMHLNIVSVQWDVNHKSIFLGMNKWLYPYSMRCVIIHQWQFR